MSTKANVFKIQASYPNEFTNSSILSFSFLERFLVVFALEDKVAFVVDPCGGFFPLWSAHPS